MSLTSVSIISLYGAFALYSIATIFFGISIRDKKSEKDTMGAIAIWITIFGFVMQLVYFITRWIVSGHAPLSNLFEFMTFLGLSLVMAFIIIYFIYRLKILGLFALPIVLIIMAYASMFPQEVSPLVPSLQSPWLWIHVTTVSLSQGVLGISFVAGLIYLVRQVDQTTRNKSSMWLEVVLFTLVVFIGFVVTTTTFNLMDYEATFELNESEYTIDYNLPAISGPKDATLVTDHMQPLMTTPGWMQGADADRKFNTLLWSFLAGSIIYLIIRLILRKRIGAAIQPLVKNTSPDLLDEIVYRAVAIGFPMFTLGGLIFAAIWAQIAWDRFWGWDPKEVWALITWFFYAAFLHLRLSRGWHGEKSAWLAVGGFSIIMFNLIVVNLVLAGLHSYA